MFIIPLHEVCIVTSGLCYFFYFNSGLFLSSWILNRVGSFFRLIVFPKCKNQVKIGRHVRNKYLSEHGVINLNKNTDEPAMMISVWHLKILIIMIILIMVLNVISDV